MRVKLGNDWQAPDGKLYETRDNPHPFPDAWEKELPTSAKKLKASEEVDYAKLQDDQTKELDIRAIENIPRYGPQPDDTLFAQVSPSEEANPAEPDEDEKSREEKIAEMKKDVGAEDDELNAKVEIVKPAVPVAKPVATPDKKA